VQTALQPPPGLGATAADEARAEGFAVAVEIGHEFGDAAPLGGGDQPDPDLPVVLLGLGHGERGFEFARRTLRRATHVGLGDDRDVRHLDDAGLHELQAVAGGRLGREDDGVGHLADRRLRLTDADGLHQHPVEQRAHQDERRHGQRREPTELVAGRHRADVEPRILRIVEDAGAIAQKRATAALGRRIDGDDADGLAALAQRVDERRRQRRLADAGRAGHADDVALRIGEGGVEESDRPRVVARRLDRPERPGEGRLTAGPQRAEPFLARGGVVVGLAGQRSRLTTPLCNAAWAAASRAIGTR